MSTQLVSSADFSASFGTNDSDPVGVSVALIGPHEEKRWALSKAINESHRANIREFDTYPPDSGSIQRLSESFDVIVVEIDSDPDAALQLAEKCSVSGTTVMVYSELSDQKLAIRSMRAGAREYLLLPLEPGIVTEALTRIESTLLKKSPYERSGSNGAAPEAHSPRPALELATSNPGRPVPVEKKRHFDARGYGRSIEEVTSPRTTPTIQWPTPAPINYRDPLTTAQLNATASVPGSFVYTPGPGYILPAGTHTLWVTFTPADAEFDSPLQTAVSIVVNKATPVLSWGTPAEISNGTPLDESHLNASASVPGLFEYSPGVGAMLPPGRHDLSVNFTPSDTANYTTAQATVSIEVAKAKPAIEWSNRGTITYGTLLSEIQLCATAFVPGQFEYTPGLGALLGAGEHTLVAMFHPEDTLNYSPSRAVASLTVAKATPAVSWPMPDPIACGTVLGPNQLNAKAAVPGTFSYTPGPGETLAPGVHRLSVTFTPTDGVNYTTSNAFVSLTVIEKMPVMVSWSAPGVISYGTPLTDAQLNATASVPGKFVYSPAPGHVLAPGRYTLTAIFLPTDAEKYAPAKATVSLEVEALPDLLPLKIAADKAATRLRSFTGGQSAPPEPAPVELNAEHRNSDSNPRETRTYKGAVYEKGEDGKWHLQQK